MDVLGKKSVAGAVSDRGMVFAEPTLAAPFKGGRMARREFQMPSVHRQEGPRPYWYIRYRVKVLVGKNQITRREKWHTLGHCDDITKREALRLRDEVMRNVNRQVYTIQSHIPFGDFVDIYKPEQIPTLSTGAQAKYLVSLSRHIVPALGAKKLCEIDTETVQAFLNSKKEAGLAWWTRNDLKNVLSSIFTKAEDWGYWDGRNPTMRTVLGRKQWKRERRILSDDQFRLLLAALPTHVQLMVWTAVSTGMRVSEVLGLRWRSVDLDRGLVSVTERYYRGDMDEPKTERARRDLPLGCLVEAYKHHKPADAKADRYVFEKDGNPLDDRAILKDFIRPAAKRLGIYFAGFGWHSFRRQNLTRIQEEGATPFEAQAQAGHSTPTMTSEYTIVSIERRKQAVLRLQDRLLAKVKVRP
jgi:integrase